MVWKISYDTKVEKDFKKLSTEVKKRIIKYINERVAVAPFDFGDDLKGNLHGLRRYRVGDYRIICEIQENIITILVLSIGHRRNVYKTR